ncbi:MAG: OstA-like protein [Saprospiraceae bacterium]
MESLLRKIMLVFVGGLLLSSLRAQEAAQDTAKSKIDVDHADVFEYSQKKGTVIQKLIFNVELRQDSIFMYCDSATIENSLHVIAVGHVIIQQGDSTSAFSDSLYYDGLLKEADLYGEVVMENGDQRLFTDQLHYNLNTKVATYTTGATLTNGETQLTSKRGYYYVDQQEAYFKDSVSVVDPQFSLRSDTLLFNTATKVVTFLGPTLVSTDSSRIYCEGGFYDTENNLAEFTQHAQFIKGAQKGKANIIKYNGKSKIYSLEGDALFEEGARKATADVIEYDERNDKSVLIGNAKYKDEKQDIVADQIVYDAKNEVYSTRGRSRVSDPPQILLADQVDFREELGLGIAKGNVIWQDTSSQLTIVCEQADYNRETGYLKASGGALGRPLLISIVDGDSLYMSADTLLSTRTDSLASDSSRLLQAYRDVRLYKSDLQALSDSLTYNAVDSLFTFFYDPIIWSDTTQFTADTIRMQMANDNIDKIFLYNKSFIINSPDEIFFNQIKGKNITASFKEGNLRKMDVQGNAESLYYARDEGGGYVGVNKTVCSDMVLFFGDNQIERILFLTAPQATMFPMKKVDHESLKISGFNWISTERPTGLPDLFSPKKTRKINAIPQGDPSTAIPKDKNAPPVKPVGREGVPLLEKVSVKEKSGTNKE